MREQSDGELVEACLGGDQNAWSALIDKYKNLIFSVPIKYGLSQDEAADVFRMVCLDLLAALSQMREPNAIPRWLLMATTHKCYHLQNQERRQEQDADFSATPELSFPPGAETIVSEVEREQNLRDAIASLSPRCQELIRMLFFNQPARPYDDIANELRIAPGPIDLLRRRCLDELKEKLDKVDLH